MDNEQWVTFEFGALCPECGSTQVLYCCACGANLLETGHGVADMYTHGHYARLPVCAACVSLLSHGLRPPYAGPEGGDGAMRRQSPMVNEGDQWVVLDALLEMAACGQEHTAVQELARGTGFTLAYTLDVLLELQTYGIAFYRYGKGWHAGEWLEDFISHVLDTELGLCASATPASVPTSRT